MDGWKRLVAVGSAAALCGCAAPARQTQALSDDYVNMLMGRCLSEGFKMDDRETFLACMKRWRNECERRKNQAQLDFYSNLGAASSRPGATFLGATGAAGRNTDSSGICR